MSASRSYLKKNLGQLLISVIGRKQLLRLSRYFLNEARLDTSNDMEFNGEVMLQSQVISLQQPGAKCVYLDVGANVGDWSKKLLTQATQKDQLVIYCFEPSTDTVALLRENLHGLEDSYRVVNKAASNSAGTASFFIAGKGLGINSLHKNFETKDEQVEEIELITLNDFVEEQRIQQIHFIKIDAEGHDFSILEGASEILRKGMVNFIQFEYSWRWIDNRKFLKDVFELVNTLNYDLGKITSFGIEFYERWDPDLETFVENNYLLVKREYRGQLKEINWWKENAE